MPDRPSAWQRLADPCAGHHGPSAARDLRCDCGSLLARWTTGGLELKCRRCKRHIVVAVEPPRPPPED